MVVMHETLIFAVYYAPRGRMRLYKLGREIAERHLFPTDLLVGTGARGNLFGDFGMQLDTKKGFH